MRAGSHSGHLANPQKYLGCPCLGMGSVLILGTDSVPTLGTDSVPILATNPVPLFGSRIWRHIILDCIFDLLLAFILGFEATRQIRQSPLELEERIACFEEFNLKRKCAAAGCFITLHGAAPQAPVSAHHVTSERAGDHLVACRISCFKYFIRR